MRNPLYVASAAVELCRMEVMLANYREDEELALEARLWFPPIARVLKTLASPVM